MPLMRCTEPAFVTTIKRLTRKNIDTFTCKDKECEEIDRLQELLN